ncbi:hypothetical protein BaRGS_00008370 [Batillaria attramentaria]|uniref:Uncharacterized protein n=1 Tax=Batillaria attramentaria TaxID=370345 RepID=A0ABD0LNA1_9CAEN
MKRKTSTVHRTNSCWLQPAPGAAVGVLRVHKDNRSRPLSQVVLAKLLWAALHQAFPLFMLSWLEFHVPLCHSQALVMSGRSRSRIWIVKVTCGVWFGSLLDNCQMLIVVVWLLQFFCPELCAQTSESYRVPSLTTSQPQ